MRRDSFLDSFLKERQELDYIEAKQVGDAVPIDVPALADSVVKWIRRSSLIYSGHDSVGRRAKHRASLAESREMRSNRQFDANVFSETGDTLTGWIARLSQLLRRRIRPRTALSTLLTIERDGFRM